MDLSKGLLNKFQIEPVTPGKYEIYNLLENGFTSKIEHSKFHFVGDIPKYDLYIPEDGEFF